MSALADKIRRARESDVEAGGFSFTIRRPTDAEAMTLAGTNVVENLLCRFVVGWNLKEIDLIPGGSPVAAAFDVDAFGEWVSDQPETLAALSSAIVAAYQAHVAKRGDAEKN
jgi:hypothetical protein